MSNYRKYPRTYHYPWSLGTTSDDRILSDVDHFIGKEIIISEKLDGENTSMYSDHIHARSLDSQHHPSRTWIKSLHGEICHNIPKNWRICGENVYAKHSIFYSNLEAHFYVFGIYDDNNICLSWDETVDYSKILGLHTIPILYRGPWDVQKVMNCWTGISTASPDDLQEGYVGRVAEAFPYDDQDNGISSKFTAKYVRKGHVQTTSHWMQQEVIPNLLRKMS